MSRLSSHDDARAAIWPMRIAGGDHARAPDGAKHADPLPCPAWHAGVGALAPRAAAVAAGHVGQHAALVEEHQALRRDPADPGFRVRPPLGTRLRHVRAVLLGRTEGPLLSRPMQTPQRPAHRPGIDPHACRRAQAVAALLQGQVVASFQDAQQRRLNVVADDRLRPAVHRLGRASSFITRGRHPAIRCRAAYHETLRHFFRSLTRFDCHQHALTQVRRIRSSHEYWMPPLPYVGAASAVSSNPRFAIAGRTARLSARPPRMTEPTMRRDAAYGAGKTALLFVDMQRVWVEPGLDPSHAGEDGR